MQKRVAVPTSERLNYGLIVKDDDEFNRFRDGVYLVGMTTGRPNIFYYHII